MVGKDNYFEVLVDPPIEVCEERDVKGLCAKVRRCEINGFTGINDPYEVPNPQEIRFYTVNLSPEENVLIILRSLQQEGFVQVMKEPKASEWLIAK
jgi:adenylylsulfate kinase-like enzyme